MLVLSRKRDEGIVIGDNVKIVVVELSNDRVKLGIDAPSEIRIVRNELYDTERFNIQAVMSKPASGLIKDIIAGKTPFKKN